MKKVKKYKQFDIMEDIEGTWALCSGDICVPLVHSVKETGDILPVHGSINEIKPYLEEAERDLKDLIAGC